MNMGIGDDLKNVCGWLLLMVLYEIDFWFVRFFMLFIGELNFFKVRNVVRFVVYVERRILIVNY